MKLKVIVGLLVVALMISLSPVVLAEAEEEKEPVTIKFWADPRFQEMIGMEEETQDPGDYERMQAREFEEMYPHVNIEVTSISWADMSTRVVTAIRAGQEPDILKDYLGRTSYYAYQGLLEPLDRYLSDEYLDNYIDSYVDMYTIDGHLHALPTHAWAQMMIMNEAIWEEAGKTEYLPEGHTWTFEEFEDALRAVADPEEEMWPLGLIVYGDGQSDYTYLGYFFGMGGEVYSEDHRRMAINSPKNKEALEMLQEFYEDDIIIPGFTAVSLDDYDEIYHRNQTAVRSGSLEFFNDEEVAREEGLVVEPQKSRPMNFPNAPGVVNGLQLGPTGFAVFEQEDDYKRKWVMEFLKFLNRKEHMYEYILNSRQLPAREDVEIPEAIRDENYEAVQTLIEERGFIDLGLLNPGYSEVRATYGPIIQEIILGEMGVEEGLQRIEEQGNRILEREFERLPENIWE